VLLQIDRAHAVPLGELCSLDRIERAGNRQFRGGTHVRMDVDDALELLVVVVELSESRTGEPNQHQQNQ